MITDTWKGLGVYTSKDVEKWERCSDILGDHGKRCDDGTIGNHADVLIHKGRAYIFYFTHPEISEIERRDPSFVWTYKHKRSALQVAELVVRNGELYCDRNHVEIDLDDK